MKERLYMCPCGVKFCLLFIGNDWLNSDFTKLVGRGERRTSLQTECLKPLTDSCRQSARLKGRSTAAQ